MLEYLIIGGGFAFAAALQPGPLQAFLLSSVTRRGWKRTLPASLAPLVSDGPVIVVVLLILNRLPQNMAGILQSAGGVLLLYFAWTGYRQWKRDSGVGEGMEGRVPSTLLQAAAVNLLNPNPYLGWSLVLGPAVLRAWAESPMNAVGLIVAFYLTITVTLAMTIVLFGTTRFLTPRGRRTLVLVSAFILAVIGAYQLVAGLVRLGAA